MAAPRPLYLQAATVTVDTNDASLPAVGDQVARRLGGDGPGGEGG
jgi:hypothetical protein